MFDPRQWSFVADMNYSGTVTISDVWIWVKWLFFYPGDLFIKILVDGFQSISQFFEITYASYGGFFSGIISFIIWYALLAVFVSLIE